MNRQQIVEYLRERELLRTTLDLAGPHGQVDARRSDKLQEVAGFSEIILRYLNRFPAKDEVVSVLECSCGKGYLGFVLSALIPEVCGRRVRLTGVDLNEDLVRHCRNVAQRLGLEDAQFVSSRIRDWSADARVDMVVSLHACDTATDEALAQGLRCGANFVHVVPCCQNQIRGQIRSGHPLDVLTDYGPVRYRMANLLTDVLRAEFMRAAGYHVEMDEIGSPRLTPKNLCITARKVKRRLAARRDGGYRTLRDMFGVVTALEKMCPGVVTQA